MPGLENVIQDRLVGPSITIPPPPPSHTHTHILTRHCLVRGMPGLEDVIQDRLVGPTTNTIKHLLFVLQYCLLQHTPSPRCKIHVLLQIRNLDNLRLNSTLSPFPKWLRTTQIKSFQIHFITCQTHKSAINLKFYPVLLLILLQEAHQSQSLIFDKIEELQLYVSAYQNTSNPYVID